MGYLNVSGLYGYRYTLLSGDIRVRSRRVRVVISRHGSSFNVQTPALFGKVLCFVMSVSINIRLNTGSISCQGYLAGIQGFWLFWVDQEKKLK